MAKPRQVHNLMPGLSMSAIAAALAIVFVLAVVTTNPAHAQSLQVLYTFRGGTDGAQPRAGLTERGGNLYGTCYAGHEGVNWGSIFEVRRNGSSWIYQDLAIFDGTLSTGVAFGPDGTIYGTSPNNLAGLRFGYVYSVRRPISAICASVACPWTGAVVYPFTGGADGATPRFGTLTFDQAGNFYGTTSLGGSGEGVVYEMMRSGSGWAEQPIYTFSGPDGANPFNSVIFDNAGNLYGTTTAGGSSGNGTVFELSPAGGGGWTEKVIYSFQGGNDGSSPTAGLAFDQFGNLYGATSNGGAGGGGTIFELTPSGGSWTHNLLYSFTGNPNCGPWASPTLDSAGNLYDTTLCNGAFNLGNVFKLTPSGGGWTYTSLHDFTGGSDGATPYSTALPDGAGNLFGTASRGGIGVGLVWEITP